MSYHQGLVSQGGGREGRGGRFEGEVVLDLQYAIL